MAICSQAEGVEKGGCGCCIQDGEIPEGFGCAFFPFVPTLHHRAAGKMYSSMSGQTDAVSS